MRWAAEDGKSVSITSQYTKYAVGTSGTERPTSGWQDSIPTVPEGQYLWTWTYVLYSDGNSTNSYSVSRNGTAGKGIVGSTVDYQVSTSGTAIPTGQWVTSIPTVGKGLYLWTRTKTTYTSGDPTFSYSVSYIGLDGEAAKMVRVSGEQVMAYENDFTGTPTPSSIKVTATLTGTTGYQWSYCRTGQTSFTTLAGATGKTYTVTHDSALWGTGKAVTLRCTSGGASDELTIVKVSSGATGPAAYTVILSNESHTFQGTEAAAIAASTKCEVIVYKGATRIAATIGAITDLPTGMSVSPYDNGTTSAYFTVDVSSSMNKGSGTLSIPITADGQTFTRVFSYTVAFKGAGGEQGYGVVANVVRDNFNEAQWSVYGAIGHVDNWTGTADIRNGCRVGDLFTVSGTSTDGGRAHTATYRSDTASGTLHGVCIGHTVSDKGDKGDTGNGVASHTFHYLLTITPETPSATDSGWVLADTGDTTPEATSLYPYLWRKETITYTKNSSLNKTIISLVQVFTHGTRPQMLRQTVLDGDLDKWSFVSSAGEVVPCSNEANAFAMTIKDTMTAASYDLLRQIVRKANDIDAGSGMEEGKYYTLSFYERTRKMVNVFVDRKNNIIGKSLFVYLPAGRYRIRMSGHVNELAATNSAYCYAKLQESANTNNKTEATARAVYDTTSTSAQILNLTAAAKCEVVLSMWRATEASNLDKYGTGVINWFQIIPEADNTSSYLATYMTGGVVLVTKNQLVDGKVSILQKGDGEQRYAHGQSLLEHEDEDGWVRRWMCFYTQPKASWSTTTDAQVYFRNFGVPFVEITKPKLEMGVSPTEWCEHRLDDTMACSHNPCGTWSPTGTYYYCRGQRDVVRYYSASNSTAQTWWRMRERTNKAGYTSSTPPYNDSTHWEAANQLKFTVVDAMFAEEIFSDKITVGKLSTYNNDGHIDIEGGLINVYGKAGGKPQIIIGADASGNAVLSICDSKGGKVWDLSVKGLIGVDKIEAKMTASKFYLLSGIAQGSTFSATELTNVVTKISSGAALTSYYLFTASKQMNNGKVMGYFYGTNTSTLQTTEPKRGSTPLDGRYFVASTLTNLIPPTTNGFMPSGLYTTKTSNHFSTWPDGAPTMVYHCNLIRVVTGEMQAGTRYVEWTADKTYIKLYDNGTVWTKGSL